MMKRILGLAFLITILSTTAIAQPTQDKADYIVMFESHEAKNASLVSSVGGTVVGGESIQIIPVLGVNIDSSLVEELEALPGVKAVEENPTAEALAQNTSWGHQKIQAAEASSGIDASNVDVAVVDTGIDYDHEDLQNNVVWGFNAVSGGNGKSAADDDNGHGTHVAGIVAAEDNNLGVHGVAPNADLYSIKVLSSTGSGTGLDYVSGVDRAMRGPDNTLGTEDDPEIMSMSLGFGNENNSIVWEATKKASEEGSLIIAAAGNSGDDDRTTDNVAAPGRFEFTVGVGATNRDDNRASFSSSFTSDGEMVEVAAPGVDIYSTYYQNSYETLSGTSMATPMVSGTTALIISKDLEDGSRDLSHKDIRARIAATAEKAETPGTDRFTGHGRINAAEAVESGDTATTRIFKPLYREEKEGEKLQVEIGVKSSESVNVNPQVRLDTGNWKDLTKVKDSYTGTVDLSSAEKGEYHTVKTRVNSDSNTTDAIEFIYSNSRPFINVTNPERGEEVNGTVEVRVRAEDDKTEGSLPVNLTIQEAVFNTQPATKAQATYNQETGLYEYTWNTTGAAEDAQYNITARTEDSLGAVSTDNVNVTVNNEQEEGGLLGGVGGIVGGVGGLISGLFLARTS